MFILISTDNNMFHSSLKKDLTQDGDHYRKLQLIKMQRLHDCMVPSPNSQFLDSLHPTEIRASPLLYKLSSSSPSYC